MSWALLFPPTCLGCGLLLRRTAPAALPLCLECTAEHQPLPPDATLGVLLAVGERDAALRELEAGIPALHGRLASADILNSQSSLAFGSVPDIQTRLNLESKQEKRDMTASEVRH